jgi:hypothetical protein
VFDTATVTGSPAAFPPTGTVTYTFTGAQLANLTAPAGWAQAGQTGLTTWTETVTLTNGGTVPDSALTPALPAGSYQFTASYSGDGNYATSPPSAPEPLTINRGTSSTATVILAAGGGPPTSTLGKSVFDTATVTGAPAAFPPSGTVTYTFTGAQLANLTPPPGWVVINATTWQETVTLVNGQVPDSALTPALRAGSYQFTAAYSGDGNYAASASGPEPLTIHQGIARNAMVTEILDAATNQPPNGVLGESVFDTATLILNPEPFTPTGTVTYEFFANGALVSEETVTLVNGAVPDSAVHGPLAAGSYSFVGVYSGDNNYGSLTSADEPLTIRQGNSITATVILAAGGGPPSGALGESVFDTATVTGSATGVTPTGTVTYTFTGAALAGLTVPAGWAQAGQTGLTTWTETVTLVNGQVPDSALTPPLPAGSFQFTASYSGDDNYAASPPSAAEPLTITQGNSITATVILAAGGGPPSGALGESVFDTATVTGAPAAFPPTGTVTYTFTGAQLANLTPPAGWVVVNPTTWQETVTLVNGQVPDSAATPVLPAGSYQFTASYSGDDKYAASPPAPPSP